MKKYLILFVAILSISAQNWKNIIETTIPTPSNTVIDQFSNSNGIHILVDNEYPTTYLKYYLINSSGSVIRSYQLESSAVDYANITGNDQILYAIYKIGNSIRTKKSTNAGQSWDTFVSDLSLSGYDCRNIDAVLENNFLHIVYDRKDNGSEYETYYKRYKSDASLEESKQVTDYGSEVGGFPTVSVSANRVHVSYNSGNSSSASGNMGNAKTRDKYNTTWQTPQLLLTEFAMRERVHAGSSKLFEFYYQRVEDMGISADLYVKERSLGSTSWSSPVFLQQFASVYNIVSVANTADGNTHIVYEATNSVAYRNYNGSSWSSQITFGTGYLSPKISSTSNDLFVVWGKNDDYLKLRQYDAIPPKPINLSATSSANDHPYITWDASICADFKEYKVYKRNHPTSGSWTLIATTTNNYYEDQTETIVTGPPIANEKNVYYAVREVDQSNNYSSYSDMLTVRVEGPPLNKISSDGELSITYELSQNYPNPFNPSTKIQFQIPEDGFVSLIVYNTLGEKVVTLVNESLTNGRYIVDFIAENLPSGIYIYRLTSNNFTSSQKMLLIR